MQTKCNTDYNIPVSNICPWENESHDCKSSKWLITKPQKSKVRKVHLGHNHNSSDIIFSEKNDKHHNTNKTSYILHIFLNQMKHSLVSLEQDKSNIFLFFTKNYMALDIRYIQGMKYRSTVFMLEYYNASVHVERSYSYTYI